MIELGSFYSSEPTENPGLIVYGDAHCLLNSHKDRSQTIYVFSYNGTTISWRSTK